MHLQCIVVYLLSVRELDSAQVALKNVAYKPHTASVGRYIERYIKGFEALNMRSSQRDDDFKYERVALILADFSQTPVKIYRNNAELNAGGILPASSTADMTNLSYDGFVDRLTEVYDKRFGTGILSWYLSIKNSSISTLLVKLFKILSSSFVKFGIVNFSIKFFW